MKLFTNYIKTTNLNYNYLNNLKRNYSGLPSPSAYQSDDENKEEE
jgi:hypothetical protein